MRKNKDDWFAWEALDYIKNGFYFLLFVAVAIVLLPFWWLGLLAKYLGFDFRGKMR